MADPRDEFSVFNESVHMFFGLEDPFGVIRRQIEEALRSQVADTEVVSIRAHGEPRFLTLGRRIEGDERRAVVTHFGFCVRTDISLTHSGGSAREVLSGTFTGMFGEIDNPEGHLSQSFLDLHDDAPVAYEEDTFRERFLAFRQGRDG